MQSSLGARSFAALQNALILSVLDARRAFHAGGGIDQRRAGVADRLGDIVRVQARPPDPRAAHGDGSAAVDQSSARPLPPGSAPPACIVQQAVGAILVFRRAFQRGAIFARRPPSRFPDRNSGESATSHSGFSWPWNWSTSGWISCRASAVGFGSMFTVSSTTLTCSGTRARSFAASSMETWRGISRNGQGPRALRPPRPRHRWFFGGKSADLDEHVGHGTHLVNPGWLGKG